VLQQVLLLGIRRQALVNPRLEILLDSHGEGAHVEEEEAVDGSSRLRVGGVEVLRLGSAVLVAQVLQDGATLPDDVALVAEGGHGVLGVQPEEPGALGLGLLEVDVLLVELELELPGEHEHRAAGGGGRGLVQLRRQPRHGGGAGGGWWRVVEGGGGE